MRTAAMNEEKAALHLEANAQPVGNASDIAETDNSDRR
jgi:hypothetical protein